MLEAVESSNIITTGSGAQINPVSRWIKNVIVSPKLTDANDWYLFAAGMPVKPFIFQSRKDVSSVLDDTQVKRNRKLDYSAELRGNAGYGFYHMAIKVVNA
jgi:phage major head subunit gpT-like protein